MAIQIYILSKLIEGNNYPYELKRQLSEPIPFDEFAGLTESKLYYHFEALTKQGLIEPVKIIKEEHRPDKQVFAITENGRKELPKKIYRLFEKSNMINEMVIGLANLEYVDRDQVAVILETKLQKHKERWERISTFRNQLNVTKSKKNFVDFMTDYSSSKAEHTAHWLEELIERIRQRAI